MNVFIDATATYIYLIMMHWLHYNGHLFESRAIFAENNLPIYILVVTAVSERLLWVCSIRARNEAEAWSRRLLLCVVSFTFPHTALCAGKVLRYKPWVGSFENGEGEKNTEKFCQPVKSLESFRKAKKFPFILAPCHVILEISHTFVCCKKNLHPTNNRVKW